MLKGNIRPILFDDAELVLSWRNQDSVRVNMYNHEIIELEAHMKWFKSLLESKDVKYFIYEQDKKPLGVLSFVDIDYKNKKASWAFYSGDTSIRGIGSEMEQLALEYAFIELNLNKLCCEVLEFNTAVISFHQKFGFKQEGIKRQEYFRDGKYFDIYQLALLKKDYLKIKEGEFPAVDKSYVWNFLIQDSKIDQFAELSGDKNPVHLHRDIAKTFGFKDRIAHGMLLGAEISKIAAMHYPSQNAIYLKKDIQFKKPVYPNVNLTGKAKLKTQIGRFVVIEYSIYDQDTLLATCTSEFLLQ